MPINIPSFRDWCTEMGFTIPDVNESGSRTFLTSHPQAYPPAYGAGYMQGMASAFAKAGGSNPWVEENMARASGMKGKGRKSKGRGMEGKPPVDDSKPRKGMEGNPPKGKTKKPRSHGMG